MICLVFIWYDACQRSSSQIHQSDSKCHRNKHATKYDEKPVAVNCSRRIGSWDVIVSECYSGGPNGFLSILFFMGETSNPLLLVAPMLDIFYFLPERPWKKSFILFSYLECLNRNVIFWAFNNFERSISTLLQRLHQLFFEIFFPMLLPVSRFWNICATWLQSDKDISMYLHTAYLTWVN